MSAGAAHAWPVAQYPASFLTDDRVVSRFWAHVPSREPGQCWEWHLTRGDVAATYGDLFVRLDGKRFNISAHRLSYAIATGAWPQLMVLHHYDNPPCVNPAHLFVGTHADNMRDASLKRGARRESVSLAEAIDIALRVVQGEAIAVAVAATNARISVVSCSTIVPPEWRRGRCTRLAHDERLARIRRAGRAAPEARAREHCLSLGTPFFRALPTPTESQVLHGQP